MLIDVKVSKKPFSSKWSLQLLIYYLLGFHSIHSYYKELSSLCIFNPYENKSYIVDLCDITDEAKYIVSHEVIGYKMTYDYKKFDNINHLEYEDYSSWKDINGTDSLILTQFLRRNFSNAFDVNDYPDGIHEISTVDYWSFLKTSDDYYRRQLCPTFSRTSHVLMLKKEGYIMFLSVDSDGDVYVFHGAGLQKTPFSPEYFYENMVRYSKAVNLRFSGYWDVLSSISKQIKELKPTKKELRKTHYAQYVNKQRFIGLEPLSFEAWFNEMGNNIHLSGKIHGCIVDLDYFTHIYINPYDVSIVPYSAKTMYDKDVYKNTISLIASRRPEMLESFKHLAKETTLPALNSNTASYQLIAATDTISEETIKVYDYDMYKISNRIKPLRKIHEQGIIQVWYENILKDNLLTLEKKYLAPNNANIQLSEHNNSMGIYKGYLGKSIEQKNGKKAKLVQFRSPLDVDISFDDGCLLNNVKFSSWKSGILMHPSDKERANEQAKEQRSAMSKNMGRAKYVGMTKKMNCGLSATITEYYDCNNVTVRFEDGLTRYNVRPDKFLIGSVKHAANAPVTGESSDQNNLVSIPAEPVVGGDTESDIPNDTKTCGFGRKKICDSTCKYFNSCTRKS